MRSITWKDRLRYRFDSVLARGSGAAIWWVVGLALLLALVGGVTFWVLGVDFDGKSGPFESFWNALIIAIGEGEVIGTSPAARFASFLFVTAAVFLTGGLIGALVAAVNERLDELRRGRSRVLESGHTVVVGWSPRLLPVIDELLAESPGGRTVAVVVLADRDKTQMEDDFRARHDGPERRRVVFRSGKPESRADLEMVSVDRARAVIVLSEGSFVDAKAVRRALAAFDVEPDEAHVVAELSNPRVARSIRASTGGGVVAVTVGEVVADMLAQAIRTPGMAFVFDELLSFEGDEFYVVGAGSTEGLTFERAVLAVPGVIVVGLVDSDGTVVLVPPRSRVIEAGERLVVISEGRPGMTGAAPRRRSTPLEPVAAPSAVNVVVLGWNASGPGVLDRLGDFLPAGSTVEVVADTTMLSDGAPEWTWPVQGRVTHTKHDPRHVISVINDARADVVAVLGYSDRLSEDEADALTLLTLMTLDRAREAEELRVERIVAHLFDNELATTALTAGASDYVVTDALASRMLVHTSREKELAAVFDDLFDASGPVAEMVPVAAGTYQYGHLADGLVTAGMIPIGTVIGKKVTLNPPLGESVDIGPGDGVIVIHRSGGR
jgi:ion channel POLLUX/CASTOR